VGVEKKYLVKPGGKALKTKFTYKAKIQERYLFESRTVLFLWGDRSCCWVQEGNVKKMFRNQS